MSVLRSAKSNRHRKSCQVESDGTGRKITHLTRGGLLGQRRGEVSRGHSSVDICRKAEVAKGRRATRQTSNGTLRQSISGRKKMNKHFRKHEVDYSKLNENAACEDGRERNGVNESAE